MTQWCKGKLIQSNPIVKAVKLQSQSGRIMMTDFENGVILGKIDGSVT